MHDQTKPLIIIVLPFTLIFKPIFNRFLHFRQSFNHSNLLWSHLFVIIPTYSWSFPPPLSHSHLLYHSHLFLLIQTSSWSFLPTLDHSHLFFFPPILNISHALFWVIKPISFILKSFQIHRPFSNLPLGLNPLPSLKHGVSEVISMAKEHCNTSKSTQSW